MVDVFFRKIYKLKETIILMKMNKLILMRGLPGSGKSTWIKEKGYEICAICPDTIRLMYATPNPTISQSYDGKVWKIINDILETRMKNGFFTILDATNITWKSIKPYVKLCEDYEFELEIMDFSNVPLEECLKRNKEREYYKYVPEEVLRRMSLQLKTTDNDQIEKFIKKK